VKGERGRLCRLFSIGRLPAGATFQRGGKEKWSLRLVCAMTLGIQPIKFAIACAASMVQHRLACRWRGCRAGEVNDFSLACGISALRFRGDRGERNRPLRAALRKRVG
jgi:hypothetical protein